MAIYAIELRLFQQCHLGVLPNKCYSLSLCPNNTLGKQELVSKRFQSHGAYLKYDS